MQAADREAVKEYSQGQARVLRAAPGELLSNNRTLKGCQNCLQDRLHHVALRPFQGRPGLGATGAARKTRACPRLFYLTLSASRPRIQCFRLVPCRRSFFGCGSVATPIIFVPRTSTFDPLLSDLHLPTTRPSTIFDVNRFRY
jgi:hypothetical protein